MADVWDKLCSNCGVTVGGPYVGYSGIVVEVWNSLHG